MDSDLRKLLERVSEAHGSRENVRGRVREAKKLADAVCRGELRKIRATGAADVRAARGRAQIQERAGVRRCRIRRSAIVRTAREVDQDLRLEERRARRDLAAAEVDAGVRPAKARRRSQPIRNEARRPLTRDEIDQRISEARSELGRVADRDYGNEAAARWYYTRKRLRSMLAGLGPRRNLYEAALEHYDDNHDEINAEYFDATEGAGAAAAHKHDREEERERARERARADHVLEGAQLRAKPAERVMAALRVRGHEPHESRSGAITCRRCGGRGRFEQTTRGALSFDAGPKLRGECPAEEEAPF